MKTMPPASAHQVITVSSRPARPLRLAPARPGSSGMSSAIVLWCERSGGGLRVPGGGVRQRPNVEAPGALRVCWNCSSDSPRMAA